MIVNDLINKFISGNKGSKKNYIIFIVGFVIIMLLLVSEFIPNSRELKKKQINTIKISVSDTEQMLSDKLEKLLSKMNGVGEVKVSISLISADEYIYAKDTQSNISKNDKSQNVKYIYTDSNNELSGLLINVKAPVVKGVVIICNGGDNAVVKKELIDLVSSLYSIGSDCIYVGKL